MRWTCPVCSVSFRVADNSRAIFCVCGHIQYGTVAGLGDRVAAVLHKVGVTPERYADAKAAVGLQRRCRCPERQKRLNELGRKLGIG